MVAIVELRYDSERNDRKSSGALGARAPAGGRRRGVRVPRITRLRVGPPPARTRRDTSRLDRRKRVNQILNISFAIFILIFYGLSGQPYYLLTVSHDFLLVP